MIDKNHFSDHFLAHEMNQEFLDKKQKDELEVMRFRQKLNAVPVVNQQSSEEVKNNIILDIDEILKKEEALQKRLDQLKECEGPMNEMQRIVQEEIQVHN